MSIQKITIFLCLFLLLGLPVGHAKLVYNAAPSSQQTAPPVERPKKKVKKKKRYQYKLNKAVFKAKKIKQVSPVGILVIIFFVLLLLSPIAFGILALVFMSISFVVAFLAVLFSAILTAFIFNILGSYGKFFSIPFSLYVGLLSLIFMILGIIWAFPMLWISCLALLLCAIAFLIWSIA